MNAWGRKIVQWSRVPRSACSTAQCSRPMVDLEWSDAPSAESLTTCLTPSSSAVRITPLWVSAKSGWLPVRRNSRCVASRATLSPRVSSRSARTQVTFGNARVFLTSRCSARVATPAADSRRTSSLPMVPVLPATVISSAVAASRASASESSSQSTEGPRPDMLAFLAPSVSSAQAARVPIRPSLLPPGTYSAQTRAVRHPGPERAAPLRMAGSTRASAYRSSR